MIVPSYCERYGDIATASCFSALLPYVLNVSFVMDEGSLSVNSEEEPGMCLNCTLKFNVGDKTTLAISL